MAQCNKRHIFAVGDMVRIGIRRGDRAKTDNKQKLLQNHSQSAPNYEPSMAYLPN